jgi:hypothetical protein
MLQRQTRQVTGMNQKPSHEDITKPIALLGSHRMWGEMRREQCVFSCLNTLDSMRPNTLRRHLEKWHPSYVNKPLEVFQRELGEYRQQEHGFVKDASVGNHRIIQSCILNGKVQETTLLPNICICTLYIISLLISWLNLSVIVLAKWLQFLSKLCQYYKEHTDWCSNLVTYFTKVVW